MKAVSTGMKRRTHFCDMKGLKMMPGCDSPEAEAEIFSGETFRKGTREEVRGSSAKVYTHTVPAGSPGVLTSLLLQMPPLKQGNCFFHFINH